MKTLILLLCPLLTFAQVEVSVGVGASHLFGDLGGTKGEGRTFVKDFQPSQLRFAGSVAVGYKRFSLQVTGSSLTGSDTAISQGNGAEQWRARRGLSFRSHLVELAVLFRQPLGFITADVGFGAAHTQRDLAEGKDYAALQPVVIYGLTVRKKLGQGYFVAGALHGRKAFTDYLDGVSLRGDPKERDAYATLTFSVGYAFQKEVLPCPKIY